MGWGNLKEAAEACDIPVQSWRAWERDNVTPRNYTEIVWQIAERAGCDYGWLLDGPRLTGSRLVRIEHDRAIHDRAVPERAEPDRMVYDRAGGRVVKRAGQPASGGASGGRSS